MSWPLALEFAGARLTVPGPGRWRLQPVPDAERVDALLAAARVRLPGAVGWLSADGGLVSNLPAWENLLLTTQWHTPASLPAMESRLSRWLAALGRDADAAARLMATVPARLQADERVLVGWLRQMLARPKLLVLEGQALALPVQQPALAALIDEELTQAALLCVAHWPLDGVADLALDIREDRRGEP